MTLRSFEDVLTALVDTVPAEAGSRQAGVVVRVTTLLVDLPVEARVEEGGVRASLPRGTMATGFDLPLSRVRASFRSGE